MPALVTSSSLLDTARIEKARFREELSLEFDDMRSRLATAIAHELRTPLTSIKGFVSTLRQADVVWSEEEKQEFLRIIEEETDRLSSLLADLMNRFTLSNQRATLDRSECSLSQIVRSIGNSLSMVAKKQQLQVSVPSNLPTIYADSTRIGQVIVILAERAAANSGEGKRVMVHATVIADDVVLSVSNEGSRMSANLVERAFNPDSHEAESSTDLLKKAMSGLAFCHKMVEAHGGRFWVRSNRRKGSTFSFALPAYDWDGRACRAELPGDRRSGSSKRWGI